ncbi:MAG TPA: 4Fe-4S ferredoxin [candidate division Zixibacteria bacterium]|jgi:2-oxoglutarate ferredoxin oxidoreductase subunit delta|nr:4Fe-4S ferredoxin [candidate division Zixibacteria bacterium]
MAKNTTVEEARAAIEQDFKQGYDLPVYVYKPWCKSCEICVAFCPKQVLEMGEDRKPRLARPRDCIRCRQCELRCPDLAIFVCEEKAK